MNRRDFFRSAMSGAVCGLSFAMGYRPEVAAVKAEEAMTSVNVYYQNREGQIVEVEDWPEGKLVSEWFPEATHFTIGGFDA